MVAELACSLLPVTLNDDGLVETNWDEGELQLIEPPAAPVSLPSGSVLTPASSCSYRKL